MTINAKVKLKQEFQKLFMSENLGRNLAAKQSA